jgi:hypothetical protein
MPVRGVLQDGEPGFDLGERNDLDRRGVGAERLDLDVETRVRRREDRVALRLVLLLPVLSTRDWEEKVR